MDGKPRNLATLSIEEMKTFLCSFDTIVLDCDGVVWMPGKTFPRTDHVIKRLRELGKKIIFFSNNSLSTREEYLAKFAKHGIPIEKADIVIPSVVAGDYLKSKNFKKKVYLVGSDASQKEMESFGISIVRESSALAEPSIMELLNAMSKMDPDVGAVVMDLDVNINYLKMMKGVAYLKDPNSILLATATEYKIPFAGTLNFIGPGYFSDTVKSVSGKEPIVMGKPSIIGGEYLQKVHCIVPKRTLMIGDTISHDIGFASNCGFISLMVLSGVNTLDDIGTGKTLVAGALANECSKANRKVSFFSRKGAECLTKWVGESEKHLRTLFEKAQQLNPSIIFFDEIDGLAPIRSSQHDQVHSSVVSTLLALMDGLNTRGQIVVIGATNRIDAIDPALRRPGRFDRELYFPLPSFKARYEILMVHAGRVGEQVDLPFIRYLAATSEGYCGSDIQALCSEALMCSVRRQFPEIYAAEHPLKLNVSTLRVERQDFQNAKNKIIPAAFRVSHTPLRRLSSKIRPLFGHTLCRAMDALRNTSIAPFIQGKKGQRTLMEINKSNQGKALSKNKNVKDHENNCPHFLLVGSPHQGQTYHLAPAMLHCLEHLPITTLDIKSLFETSGRTPEEALIHKMKEARHSLPGVIYVPDISGWWTLVDVSAKAVFLTMVREMDAGDLPILLLSTAHTPYSVVPPEIQQLFSEFHGQVFTMENPSEKERREFFSQLFVRKALKPPSANETSSRDQKQVLLCKVPVNFPRTSTEEPEIKAKLRKRKTKERNTSTSAIGKQLEKCNGTISLPQKQKFESPADASDGTAKRQREDCINSTDDEDEELKKGSGYKRARPLLINAEYQRKSLCKSRIKKQRAKSSELIQKPYSFEESGQGLNIQPQREPSNDNEFPHECEGGEEILSASSSITSISGDAVKIDQDKLEGLLNRAVTITDGCPLDTILMLHSKLLHCVSKYKDTLDRTNLPQELEENLNIFEDTDMKNMMDLQ
ncbi:uncharacterized protein [Hetaerina americana]|uniref:uncharacterized protein n=1 Tax=Hetaerina americana TaxID=62018 RepID=UPI003A7F38A8